MRKIVNLQTSVETLVPLSSLVDCDLSFIFIYNLIILVLTTVLSLLSSFFFFLLHVVLGFKKYIIFCPGILQIMHVLLSNYVLNFKSHCLVI